MRHSSLETHWHWILPNFLDRLIPITFGLEELFIQGLIILSCAPTAAAAASSTPPPTVCMYVCNVIRWPSLCVSIYTAFSHLPFSILVYLWIYVCINLCVLSYTWRSCIGCHKYDCNRAPASLSFTCCRRSHHYSLPLALLAVDAQKHHHHHQHSMWLPQLQSPPLYITLV